MFHQSCPENGYLSRLTTAPAHARYGAAAALLLAACAGDVVDVGENMPYPVGAQCQGDTTVRGSVIIENQEQLNDLAGCRVLEGNLDIVPFRDADLRALHALLRVDGDVVIGSEITNPFVTGDGPETYLEVRLLLDEIERARGAQWLETLEGLEQLESVGSLTIQAPIESIVALSGLRRITTGRLGLSNTALDDLRGLEELRGVTDLLIGGLLTDMTALRLPASMTSLYIAAPVEALDVSDVRSVSHLSLQRVFLEDLDMFQDLEQAEGIDISECPFLRHMDGLNGVTGLSSFSAYGNLSLQRLPESLNSIEQLESFHMVDNPRLERIPELTMLERIVSFVVSTPSFYELGYPSVLELPTFPRMNLENAAPLNLERIVIKHTDSPSFVVPRSWKSADLIELLANDKMTELDFGGLESVDTMAIEQNNALSSVTLGSLARVRTLDLVRNRLLPASAFDGVQVDELHLRRSLDS